MTTFSDETLLAFADDELDPTMRAAVAAAMRDDPEIERRIARQRAMRSRIHLAYSADRQQPLPQRLRVAESGRSLKSTATVTDLAAVRAASAAIAGSATNDSVRPTGQPPSWWPVGALAASLLVGVAVGYFALHPADLLVAESGGWVAGGELAAALSGQLGGDRSPDASVRTPLSFVSKSGDYCRVFGLTGTAAAGGLACRLGDCWHIRVLVQDGAQSPVIMGAVRDQIVGEPLDHDAEIKARQAGWRPVAEAAPHN